MLRNYKKNASLKKWCFKSGYFAAKGFTTPDQLELFETRPNGSVSICSEFLFTVVNNRYNEAKASALNDQLIDLKYYELIGFDAPPNNKKITMDQVEEMGRKTVRYKLSRANILLIRAILEEQVILSNQDFMFLCNKLITIHYVSHNT